MWSIRLPGASFEAGRGQGYAAEMAMVFFDSVVFIWFKQVIEPCLYLTDSP